MTIKSIRTGWTGISLNAGNPVFSPVDITGLKAWYDAADVSSISLSGSNVTQWNDKSGNEKHLTQDTDSRRPASGTRTVNGKNALDYNSNVDTLANSDNVYFKFLHETVATFFIVYKLDTDPPVGDTAWFFATRGSNLAAGPGVAFYVAQSNSKIIYAVNTTSTNIVSNTSTSTGNGTATQLWINSQDPANATAASRSNLYKNLGAAEANNTATGTPSTSNAAQGLRLGDYAAGGALSFDGLLCEVIVYDSQLSTTNREKVRDYLIAKWGI